MTTESKQPTIISKLGDGLIMRRSTQEDAEALGAFNGSVHSEEGPEKPDERVAAWTHDLLRHPHPTFKPGDFTIVEDTQTGKIVSSMNLISQTWSYAGIEFKVGRPEIVGTLPEYRQRGLVRAQFETIHAWSAARGELVQAITGIPFFYRQFGYEMCMDLGGGRTGFEALLPELDKGESEPFRIRPATVEDIPFWSKVYAHACRKNMVSCPRSEAILRYELTGQSEKNVNRNEMRIIETTEGEPVGILTHPWFNWNLGLITQLYELKPGVSWLAVTPSVARYLWRTGGEYAQRDGKKRGAYSFWLGLEHPACMTLRDRMPRARDPYSWYLRLPNMLEFILTIKPALEDRLADSIAVGHSGELKINFYQDGLRLVFEHGKISGVENWKPGGRQWGQASFPDLTFLQLLFGYRTIEQLEQSYADCWYDDDEARLLLTILFPRQPSNLLPLA